MTEQPPKHFNLRQRVNWFMDRDKTSIMDAEVFKSKWGEYPASMKRKRSKKSDR